MTAETSNARGLVEYEYEVWQGDAWQAGGSTTDYAAAQSEAGHYAMIFGQDGPVEVRIYEKRLLSAAPPPAAAQQGQAVAERQAWYEQQIALAEGQWAAAFLDRWECGDDVPSKEHYVALWLAERAAPQPADARGDVRGLVALAEQMERDAAGCRRDGYTDAAVVKEDCAQRIRQTLGISAIAEALAAEGVQAEPKPVLSEPDRIGLYQGPDDCPQLMVNDRPVAIFPAGSWAKVCDALDSITGSVQPEPKAEARGVVDDRIESILHKLNEWSRAYPEDIFREPSKDEREWLHATKPGLMDRVSASMGRHMVRLIRDDLRALTAALTEARNG